MNKDNRENEIVVHDNSTLVVSESIQTEINTDLEEARNTYKELIERGMTGLDLAYDVADGSAHPRAIEVFSGLITAISQLNSKLVDLQKAKAKINDLSGAPENIHNTQNNSTNIAFNGSPAELQKLIADSILD